MSLCKRLIINVIDVVEVFCYRTLIYSLNVDCGLDMAFMSIGNLKGPNVSFVVLRHMVLALKELSIRGDFRTTVEYLVNLLEDKSFRENHFDTAWLDKLIMEKVKVRNSLINQSLIYAVINFVCFRLNILTSMSL